MAFSASPELGGMSGDFSPADFGDALPPTAVQFDMGGHGSLAPYSSAMNAIVNKHMDEIRGKSANMIPSGWKKRLRDFLNQKNNELLDFLKVSVPSHPTLGHGDILLRRFGNPQVTPTHPSVRDMVLDISGEDVLADINSAIKVFSGEGGLKDYANQTRIIYEEYTAAGDEILRQQNALKAKLSKFDRIQGRVSTLFEVDPNEHYQPLMEASEAYLKKVFESNMIEEDYTKLMQAYRRFAILRGVVSMSRSLLAQESEPICSICLHESVGFALTPCGHTLCGTCVRRQGSSCFMCRTPIKEKVKLFFG